MRSALSLPKQKLPRARFLKRTEPKQLNIRGEVFTFNPCLQGIIDEIARSTDVLDLPFDWDDEGGSAVAIETWRKAARLVLNYAKFILETWNVALAPPTIMTGPRLSIDIEWDTEIYRILVNVPEAPDNPLKYYGDDYAEEYIKGALPGIEAVEWFAAWLKRLSESAKINR